MSTNTGTAKKGKLSGKGSNLALQAGILAGAGIVSRIIGLLYRSPLYQILGDEGNGYYGSAYAIYAMVIMIATYSIPTAVSKLVAGKIAMGQYKSARRIYYCTFIYVVIAGAVAALITYFGAEWFVSDQPNAVLSLKILAPTIFISGFLAIFRGYLQAYNTMVPTSISVRLCEKKKGYHGVCEERYKSRHRILWKVIQNNHCHSHTYRGGSSGV